MTFKEKLLLKFQKNKCVGAILYWKDHRITEHIVKYEGDYIVIGERRFTINKDNVFYRNGIPYFIYYANDPEPIPVNATEWKPSPISSYDFQLAIDSHVVKDALNAADEDNKLIMIVVLIGVINGALTAGVGYYLYTLIHGLMGAV